MEEPKKVLKAQYIGSVEVPHATGMDTLNDAIDKVTATAAPSAWENVNVSVAPSMISVNVANVRRK
jgi:amyloid beta (A4) precursor protein-binding family B protein 2 (Fe65-like)